MIQEYKNKCKEKGVSPVIGVILLVAVTVALVALSTVIVFNIGSDVSDTADITLDVSEQDDSLDVTVVRNENVDELRLVGPDTDESFSSDVGSSATVQGEAGSYNIVAVLEDGSEETVQTVTIAEDGEVESETATGTVSVNPDIEGATVEALDSDGNVLESTITNENGEYEFDLDKSEIDTIQLVVDGFEHEDLDHTLYASAERSDFTEGEPIDFSFTDTSVVDFGGEDVIVSNKVSEETSTVNTIANIEQLQAMNEDLSADYKLVRDIDASDTENWNLKEEHEEESEVEGGNGVVDVQLDYNHVIESLEVEDEDGNDLIHTVVNGEDDIIEVDTDADDYTDDEITTLVISYDLADDVYQGFEPIGDSEFGDREEDEFTGSLDGQKYEIEGLYIDRPEESVGLIGWNEGTVNNIGVVNVDITGDSEVGGLVGFNSGGDVSESYAEGDVTGDLWVGGLVGYNNNDGEVSESYATGTVTGEDDYVGGLVGRNEGDVSESYATGTVTGESDVGGLVGYNFGDVSESYATGTVTGESDVGGLVGFNDFGTVSESYWDTNSEILEDGEDVSEDGDGGTGLTTEEMTGEDAETDMSGFDFTNTWVTVDSDYPELRVFE